jgi:hypothetical protein
MIHSIREASGKISEGKITGFLRSLNAFQLIAFGIR